MSKELRKKTWYEKALYPFFIIGCIAMIFASFIYADYVDNLENRIVQLEKKVIFCNP